jgi:hypothetical protein
MTALRRLARDARCPLKNAADVIARKSHARAGLEAVAIDDRPDIVAHYRLVAPQIECAFGHIRVTTLFALD